MIQRNERTLTITFVFVFFLCSLKSLSYKFDCTVHHRNATDLSHRVVSLPVRNLKSYKNHIELPNIPFVDCKSNYASFVI